MKRLQIFGSTPSPYTQKILSLLRYRRIPYDVHWGQTQKRLEEQGIELPKPVLLPVILFENEDNKMIATTDSTPIIRRLESDYNVRQVVPNDPALSFINYLLEDFADEWLTKYMFHYRWHFDKDISKAGDILPLVEFEKRLSKEEHQQIKDFIIGRQTKRLWVVGSNNETANLIDKSFKRFIKLLNEHLQNVPFLLGNKPSSADFAFYGQLSQLVNFDPTPRKICHQLAPRVVAWVEVMTDLSGINSDTRDWINLEENPSTLKDIFYEFGKMYAPLLVKNAEAVASAMDNWEVDIEGSLWKQKTFSYQAKCLNWIRDEFNTLNDKDQIRIREFLKGTNSEQIL